MVGTFFRIVVCDDEIYGLLLVNSKFDCENISDVNVSSDKN